MNVLIRTLGWTLFGTCTAFAQAPAKLEARVRQLETELAGLGYSFPQPTPLRVVSSGEYSGIVQAECDRLFGAHWAELQRYLRQGFGIECGKSAAETRAQLAQPWVTGFALVFDSAANVVVVDQSRADSVSEQELARGVFAALRAREPGWAAVMAPGEHTWESVALGRALLAGEAELASLALAEGRAGRDLKALSPSSLDAPLPKGVGDSLTRVLHRLGRDLMLERYRGFGFDGARALWNERPRTTEQLAHTVKLYRDTPKPGELPAWDAALGLQVVRKDELGELGMFALLLDAGVPLSDAQLAAIGWDGDEVQCLRDARGELSMVWRISFDRHDDVRQFATAVGPIALGQIVVRGLVLDWVRSDSIQVSQALIAALDAAKPKATPSPEDRETTAQIEANLESSIDLRPRIEGGRWLHPRFALSIPVPENWVMELVNGQAFLMGPQIGKFKDNISVAALETARGQSIDEILVSQEKLIRAQTGMEFFGGSKQLVDNREVGLLRSTGKLGENDLSFTTMVYLYEGQPVVVTISVARANLEFMQRVIDATLAGTRFVSVRAGRGDGAR
ncbi:MAG: hypothetical protein IT454_03680 [Planctomycetes bacterium]|nr:hypothetical protein [Planctomycetota bacterium]